VEPVASDKIPTRTNPPVKNDQTPNAIGIRYQSPRASHLIATGDAYCPLDVHEATTLTLNIERRAAVMHSRRPGSEPPDVASGPPSCDSGHDHVRVVTEGERQLGSVHVDRDHRKIVQW
jgi:hypothetical protein